MEQQLDFFGVQTKPEPKYRLFVGVFPSAQAVEHIAELQQETKQKFGLSGNFRRRQILHVTLHHIGDYPEISEHVIDGASRACETAFAGVAPFEVTFDHVMSFAGRPGNLPFVLVNPAGNATFQAFHRRLITELVRRNLAKGSDFNFVPHVTLLYDRKSVPQQPVLPVGWLVNEAVLILSHLGATKYDRLATWSLQG